MAKKNNKDEVTEENIVEEEQKLEEKPDKKNKKTAHKEKKISKLKNKFFKPNDIKYRGPLTYRYLRIFAWVALAFGQVLVLNSIGHLLMGWDPIPENVQTAASIVSSLSTPFFIIASFGLILSNQKNYKNVLATYGAAFFAMGLGITLVYYRYINGLLVKLGLDETAASEIIKSFLGDRVQINVFADLFAFACFHFFLNYTPKKSFKGNWIYLFRALMVSPLAFVIASYIIKVHIALHASDLQFYVYPFLTTKSPIIFAVFVLASLGIKYRERIFIKLGATKEEYQAYLKTNRNSLAFSVQLSLIFLSSLVLEVTLLIILVIIYVGFKGYDVETFLVAVNAYQSGQSIYLLLAIPFILLYSYTKGHKNKLIDLFIPIIGIGLIVIVYLEGIYQLIINTIGA